MVGPRCTREIVSSDLCYSPSILAELKKHLKSPVKRLNSSWMAFYLKYVSENRQPAENLDTMRDHMRAASEVWRTMTAEEKEVGIPSFVMICKGI